MSETPEITPEQMLAICNLASNGMPLKDAKAKILGCAKKAEAAAPTGEKKLSAKEKKAAIATEIEALGGEAPEEGASVAKFEEALTAAKAAKDKADSEDADLM